MSITKIYTTSHLKLYFTCLFSVSIALLFFLASCSKDKDVSGGNLSIGGDETEAEIGQDGRTLNYTIETSGSWEARPIRNVDWVSMNPMKGSGSGQLDVKVKENKTSSERELTIAFKVNGQFQEQIIKIKQDSMTLRAGEEIPPFVKLDLPGNSIDIPRQKLSERVYVRAKGEWEIRIPEDKNWVTIDPLEGIGDEGINVSIDENTRPEAREVELQFYLNGELADYSFTIAQEGAPVTEVVILDEQFDWLEYGSPIFYTTTGETRIDNWAQADLDHGWTSTVNPVSNDPPIYARYGFVKLGKTNYGADLISPKLSAVDGTENLLVEFKAVPYQTAAGTRDDNILKVEVVGPGTISTDEFVIGNWPDYTEDPDCILIWEAPETKRTFTVTGATSETQIRFLGKAFDLRGNSPNKNRIFLDDIKVTVDN